MFCKIKSYLGIGFVYVLIKIRIRHWYAYVYGFRQYADRFFGFLHLHNGCSGTIQWIGLGLGLGLRVRVRVRVVPAVVADAVGFVAPLCRCPKP